MKLMTKIGLAAVGAAFACTTFGETEAASAQDAVAKAAPREMKLIIASFGTIDSQAEVEKWLGDQLKPTENLEELPTLSQAEKVADPNMASAVVRANWQTKKLEYMRVSKEMQAENARRAKILTNLKMAMLSDASQRYVQLGHDYLQSRIRKLSGSLIKVVDRGNMGIQQTEKAIKGKSADMVNGADCILSVVMGDREEDSRTIPIDNAGTKVKRTTYTAPYVGKIRDLDGNVLIAFDGTAQWSKTRDNVVKAADADPARKLIEAVCDKIAAEVVAYFTTELKFKVKAPEGMDADDAEIYVDGREVTSDGTRVLAFEHLVKGELDGCKSVRKVVEIENDTPTATVKLNFKKQVEKSGEEDGE